MMPAHTTVSIHDHTIPLHSLGQPVMPDMSMCDHLIALIRFTWDSDKTCVCVCVITISPDAFYRGYELVLMRFTRDDALFVWKQPV